MVSLETFSAKDTIDYVGKQKTMLVMELNANGESSQITEVSQRVLYNYIKTVVSSFASLNNNNNPNQQRRDSHDSIKDITPDSLFGEPVHSRDLRKLRQPFSSQNQPSVMVIYCFHFIFVTCTICIFGIYTHIYFIIYCYILLIIIPGLPPLLLFF